MVTGPARLPCRPERPPVPRPRQLVSGGNEMVMGGYAVEVNDAQAATVEDNDATYMRSIDPVSG